MIILSAQDHENRLPNSWEEIESKTTADMFICPETTRYFHKIGGYGYNANIRGKATLSINDPQAVIFTADAVHPHSYLTAPSDIDRTRHQGAFCCSYLDGHVKYIKPDEEIKLK